MVRAALIPAPASAPVHPGSLPGCGSDATATPDSGTGAVFEQLLLRAHATAPSSAAPDASTAAATQGKSAAAPDAGATAAREAGTAAAETVSGEEPASGAVAGRHAAEKPGTVRTGSVPGHTPRNALVAAQHNLQIRETSVAGRGQAPSDSGKVVVSGPARGVSAGGKNQKSDKGPDKRREDRAGLNPAEVASAQIAVLAPAVLATQATVPAHGSSPPALSGRGAGIGPNPAREVSKSATPVYAGLERKAAAPAASPGAAPGNALDAKAAAESAGGAAFTSSTSPRENAPAKSVLTGDVQAAKVRSALALSPAASAVLPGAVKATLSAASREVREAGAAAEAADAKTQAGAAAAASAGSSLAVQPAATLAAVPAPGAAMGAAAATSPYDRIDQGVAPIVLHSGAQQVAVGVRDSSLGWVEIRAQNVSGHVEATLVTASGQTQASLAAQLPAMAQFVAQHDVRLGALAVQPQTAANAGLGGGMSHGSGAGQSGANPGGGFSQGGFNPGGFAGGFGNSSGGFHPPPSRSGLGSGRSAREVPVAGASGNQVLYESGEDTDFGPVSYINVRA